MTGRRKPRRHWLATISAASGRERQRRIHRAIVQARIAWEHGMPDVARAFDRQVDELVGETPT